MRIDRILSLTLAGLVGSVWLNIPSFATPKQYRAGYAAGAAVGKRIGKMDGSGEAGTNSMHTNATCSIEHPKSKDYDRGYDKGCRTAYEQTFLREYKNRKNKK